MLPAVRQKQQQRGYLKLETKQKCTIAAVDIAIDNAAKPIHTLG